MKTDRLILIVEDEPDTAALLEHHFHQRGWQTLVAADGYTALRAVRQWNPDLVILDLMLPGLHGLEVCEQLKSDRATQHIPILVLTALGTVADKLRGFGHGADDYLTKPFAMAELIVRVYALLRRAGEASAGVAPAAGIAELAGKM